MKEILLTQGKVAKVDDEDFEYLNQWKWQAVNSKGSWYASRNKRIGLRIFDKHIVIQMHREIMKTPDDMETDHRDNDGLNNQRHNLRNCIHIQNGKNRKKNKNNTSGYKGVSWDKRDNKWRANIKVSYRTISLGFFLTPEQAAHAYDEAAKKYHGKFANLNFPE